VSEDPKPPYAWSMPGWPSERPSDDPQVREVWGYAERFSYFAGETLRLHVSCSAPCFAIEICRDGAAPEVVLRRSG